MRSSCDALAPAFRRPYVALHPSPTMRRSALSLSLYDVSIPVYIRMLGNLAHFLDKADAHAQEASVDPVTYAQADLGHGMFNLTRQIQLASDAAKGGAARLAGIEAP